MKKNDTPFLDRVFLHSKNADERLFDMILRIITFIVLIIIVWLYADLAHVKASSLTVDEYVLSNGNQYNLKWYFNDSDYSNMANLFSDIPYNSNYNFGQVNIPGKVVVTDDMNFDDYYFVQARGIPNASQSLFTVFIPKSVDVAIIDYNKIYSSETCSCYYVWADKTDSLNTSKYYRVDLTLNEGVNDYLWLSSLDFNYFFGNIPYLKGSNISPVDYFENGNNFDVSYNANYLMYHDLIFNPNNIVDVESNKNHMALESIQVGLSCQNINQDLSSSSVIIGVDVDDWITNHIDDYSLSIKYTLEFNGTFNGVNSPYNGVYSTSQFLVPLKTFVNDCYFYGVSQIAADVSFPYGNLSGSFNSVTSLSEPYYGLFPSVKSYTEHLVSDTFKIIIPSNNSDIRINKYSLTVECYLYQGINYGGKYVKTFDFLTGSQSVLNADILTNSEPWLGVSTPQISGNVPPVGSSGSGGSSAIAYGDNTSVVVNNYGGKVPVNVHNQLQLDDCVRRYNEVRQVFFADIQAIAEDTGSNNFIRVLNQALPQIPGMSIYMTYVSLICFVALILIVLKVLLF